MDSQAFTLLMNSLDKLHSKVDNVDEKITDTSNRQNITEKDIINIKSEYIKRPTLRQVITVLSVPSVLFGIFKLVEGIVTKT